ncbi:MAG TPA: hypothetical protein VFT49_02995 [Candidatus Saccharimonadales bacterium]|nr:hypothetical protein [Candidatus Saccharimonadales bacterium]
MTEFAGLLWSRATPARRPLGRLHTWLDSRLRPRKDLIGWLWRMFHNREWQKSALQSAAFWVLATLVISRLLHQLGHGWYVSVGVSLGMDSVTYAINKLWIWRKRNVGIKKSCKRNFSAWAAFFAFNAALAWMLMHPAGVGTMHARYILGAVGFVANPVIFTVRDRLVFSPEKIQEVFAEFRQILFKTVA